MSIQPGAMLNTQGFGNRPENVEVPHIDERAPTTTDSNYPIGKRWINTVTGNEYSLGSISTLGGVISAAWTLLGTNSGPLNTLTGNSGGAIAPSSGNINILGNDLTSVVGSGSTLTLTLEDGGYPITPYVVGPTGQAGYQTIQSAITAASGAGGNATVYIQPGSYTESLTLASTVNIEGTSDAGVTIIGVHTPPSSGSVEFLNCTLQSATHVFSSAAIGSTFLSCVNCTFNVTNGFVYNLTNWTGALSLFQCGSIGTNDGIISNTGGSTVAIAQSDVGNGTGQTMVISGTILLQNSLISCPFNAVTGANVSLDGCQFVNTVTLSNNSTGYFDTCHFKSGASAAITMSSSAAVKITNSTINSSNNPAIAGAGAGTLTLGDITFVNNSAISGSLTTAWAATKTGPTTITGNLTLSTAGNKQVYTSVATTTTAGANSAGTVTLVGGTATVATTAVAAGSKIRISRQGIAATGAAALGILTIGTITAGVSFVINSVQAADATALQASDVSSIWWEIVN